MTSVVSQMKQMQWKFLKQDMVKYFASQGPRTSTVELDARLWPRFKNVESLREKKFIPCLIGGHGEGLKVAIPENVLTPIAFDEKHGHLSSLFKGRLFRIRTSDTTVDECVVEKVVADTVGQKLYFVNFKRHMPGVPLEVEVPLSLVGLLGCPAYLSGAHVELARPTVTVEVIGSEMPPPLRVDTTKLFFTPPTSSLTLRSLVHQLPKGARFSRDLDLDSTEVAWAYVPNRLPEVKLPDDYMDPNFWGPKMNRKYVLTYKNFWPKQ